MTRECKQQFTLRIAQANRTEMIMILYEMILCYLEEGKEAHGAGDRAAFCEALRKTRGCFDELLISLNLEYEIALNLQQLYLYCIRRLAHAERKNDMEPIEQARKVISSLHKAYVVLSQQDKSGPVMCNTQAVYAGLTYGKYSLTENLAYQSMNRGVFA